MGGDNSEEALTQLRYLIVALPVMAYAIVIGLMWRYPISRARQKELRDLIEELYGEMLLPLGMQEIADTVVWPSDVQRETYDESPPPRTAPPAMSASPDQPSYNFV